MVTKLIVIIIITGMVITIINRLLKKTGKITPRIHKLSNLEDIMLPVQVKGKGKVKVILLPISMVGNISRRINAVVLIRNTIIIIIITIRNLKI